MTDLGARCRLSCMPRTAEKPLSTEEKVLIAGAAALAAGLVSFWFFSPDAPGAASTTPTPAGGQNSASG